MSGRSSVATIAAILLLAAAVAAVALSADSTDATPRGTLAVIFALTAAVVLTLLLLQRRSLRGAARGSRGDPSQAGFGGVLENPMTVDEHELWRALALRPIEPDELEARAAGREAGLASQSAAIVVTAMIFVFVPASYLLESFVPLLIGAPLIVGYALIKGLGALGAGGLGGAYENLGRAVAPLGLELTERPEVGVGLRAPPAPGMRTEISGAVELAGTRHGRQVQVRFAEGAGTVRLGARTEPFAARSSDGRIRGKRGELPGAIAALLQSVPASTEWKSLRVEADGSSITIRRRVDPSGRMWLADLWLAERIADG